MIGILAFVVSAAFAAETTQIYPAEVKKTLSALGISLEPPVNPQGGGVTAIVDKPTQTITITAPDLAEPWVRYVSTGGGLKKPNGERAEGREPYCASTPQMPAHFIPATAATLEEVHLSGTFAHNGEPAEMRWAIRVQPDPKNPLGAGVFFHRASNGSVKIGDKRGTRVPYMDLLGQNVSGECIRLDDQTSKLLFGLAIKYGGITATIQGEDPPSIKQGLCQKMADGTTRCVAANHCDAEMLRRSKIKVAKKKDREQDLNAKAGGLLAEWFSGINATKPNGATTAFPEKSTRLRRNRDSNPSGSLVVPFWEH